MAEREDSTRREPTTGDRRTDMGSVKMRRMVEREIAVATIKGLLDEGYRVSVFDGEEETLAGASETSDKYADQAGA